MREWVVTYTFWASDEREAEKIAAVGKAEIEGETPRLVHSALHELVRPEPELHLQAEPVMSLSQLRARDADV